MNRKLVESALSEFLKAWEDKDVSSVVNLLSTNLRYYETPLCKPLTTKKQVRELWSPVPKFEADISLRFETICLKDSYGLFRVKGIYKHDHDKVKKTTKIDRIFLLSVDATGKITKFMQWRESKDFGIKQI